MRSSVPPGAAAEICRATHRAARERRRRIFATGGGCQGRMALRGRAWIDGAHISGTSLTRGCGEARKRGPSRQEPCIAAAIDVHKSPVAAAIGRGKPPAGRMEDGLQRHIAKGPVIVGGKEKSLNSPAKAVKGVHQTHTADANGPIRLECMPLVNDLCSWLKRCLQRFAGTDPANLQSCLSWYVCPFRVNQARDEWPETERAARHLLMADAYFCSST